METMDQVNIGKLMEEFELSVLSMNPKEGFRLLFLLEGTNKNVKQF